MLVAVIGPRTFGGQACPGRQVQQVGKPRRSRDALPENTRYRDDGCSVSRSCFTCPLPRCRYEEPGGLRAVLNQLRDRQMLELRAEGASVEELALRFSVSRRTVFRVLEGTSTRSRRPACPPGRAGAPSGRRSGPVPIFLRRTQGGEARKEANCA